MFTAFNTKLKAIFCDVAFGQDTFERAQAVEIILMMLIKVLFVFLFSKVLQVTYQGLLWSYPNDSTTKGKIIVKPTSFILDFS